MLARETSLELFTPTVLAVQSRNYCSAGNPNERRQSHNSLSVKARCIILDKIHTGHQGIQKCRERAKSGVWWPNLSNQIEDLVRECPTCIASARGRLLLASISGIPETVIFDNGPRNFSAEFTKFAEDWGFTHVTSSPKSLSFQFPFLEPLLVPEEKSRPAQEIRF